jgi:hypothetical protein
MVFFVPKGEWSSYYLAIGFLLWEKNGEFLSFSPDGTNRQIFLKDMET